MMDKVLIQSALEAGATKAEMIDAGQVVTSAAFRDICATNTCGKYGRCYMCPPDVGDIGELMEKVKEYPRGLLYQTISGLEDSFDIEGMTAAGAGHVQVSQRLEDRLRELLPAGYLHLTCGGCRLCETCAKAEGKPCVFPERAMPSVESYGIDVYNTVKGTGLKYINGANTVTFFGIAFFKPEEHA